MIEKRQAGFGELQFAVDALVGPGFDLFGYGAREQDGEYEQQRQQAAHGEACAFQAVPEYLFQAGHVCVPGE